MLSVVRLLARGNATWRTTLVLLALLCAAAGANLGPAAASQQSWRVEWPHTDFSKHDVDLSEIRSGGPPRDGIPSIDAPRFEQLANGRASGWSASLADQEPVIALTIGNDTRAYPLRILTWHEIVNDTVQRRVDGSLIDVPYDVTFAFVFRAFRPKSPIHQSAPEAEHVSE